MVEYTETVRGFVDLHCHWIAGIDDGARTVEASLAMLRGLKRAGFDTVMATPHMRPGMFDNDRDALVSGVEVFVCGQGDGAACARALPDVVAGCHRILETRRPRV